MTKIQRFMRMKRVFESCTTPEQHRTAIRYRELLYRHYLGNNPLRRDSFERTLDTLALETFYKVRF
jgi:hypothetical protein